MSILRPLGDRYIIDPILPDEKVNGIIIPKEAQEAPNKGKVIARSKLMEKEEVVLGDIVMFSNYAGSHINFDDKEMFVVRYSDLMAVLNNGTVRPLGDRYIVDPIIADTTISGIITPTQKPPHQGKVMAMSKKMEKEDIKLIDIVMFSSYAGSHINFNNKDMFLIRHHDIMAIL